METGSPVVYHDADDRHSPKKDIPKIFTELTKEERELFRECNRESLYYRCLPMALVGMVATHMAVRRGILTAHPVWGSSLKMTGAAFLGWVAGKISYRRKCEDKFVHLENSPLGEAIRRSRGYKSERFRNEFSGSRSDEEFNLSSNSPASYDDYYSSSGSLNLDVDKNIQFSGLDDRERPSTDREVLPSHIEVEPITKFTTYDELRQKNRDEFEKSHRQPSRSDQSSPVTQKPWSSGDNMPSRRFSGDSGTETKNKYGDSWDNPKFV